MSFSSDVKKELCRTLPSRKCCAQAECYGLLLYANRFDGSEVRIVTESEDLAARLPALFKKAFHITFDRLPDPGPGKRVFPSRMGTSLLSFPLSLAMTSLRRWPITSILPFWRRTIAVFLFSGGLSWRADRSLIPPRATIWS